jgi:hypothetical protein
MLSPLVARLFLDLGLIARVQHELESYQPWATLYDEEYEECAPKINWDFLRGQGRYLNIEQDIPEILLSPLGSPLEGRFYYPSDKRRTKEVTGSMRLAEHNLDIFWSHIDKSYKAKNQYSQVLNQCTNGLESKLLDMERTPVWIEPELKIPSHSKSKPATDLTESFPSLDLGFEGLSSKFVPLEPKGKIKTRGPASAKSETTNEIPLSLPSTKEPTFILKNQHYIVLKTLFFQPSQTDLPGEIPWTDFLSAMSEVGFATEKLYGSVWQFTPTSLDVENGYLFPRASSHWQDSIQERKTNG